MINTNEMTGGLGPDILHYNAILGGEQHGLMRLIFVVNIDLGEGSIARPVDQQLRVERIQPRAVYDCAFYESFFFYL